MDINETCVISEEVLSAFLYGHKNDTYFQKEQSFATYPLPLPGQVKFGPSLLPGSDVGVFARSFIKSGTEMGPFIGNVVPLCNINHTKHNNHQSWEIFDTNGIVLYLINGGDDEPVSWLSCVQSARCDLEQNIEMLQIGPDIYYRTIKDIHIGEELLVWYRQSSHLYMGMPEPNNLVSNPTPSESLENAEVKVLENVEEISKLRCVVCKRGFNSRSNLRSHMRTHTLEKPFVCKYCGRKFSQSSTLRNHVRLHTGEKPYSCSMCSNSYSQLAGLRAHQRSSKHRPMKTDCPITTDDNYTMHNDYELINKL